MGQLKYVKWTVVFWCHLRNMLTLPIRYVKKCGTRPFGIKAVHLTYFRTCPVTTGHGRKAPLFMSRWSSSTAQTQSNCSQGLTLSPRGENFRQRMLPITSLLLSPQRFGFDLTSFRRELWCESTAASYHSQQIERVKEIAIEDVPIKSVANTTIIRIWHLVKPDIILLLAVILTAVGAAMVNLSTPTVTGQLINIIAKSISAAGTLTLEELNGPALKLLGLFATQGLLTFAHISLVSALGENIASRLKRDLFAAILSQDIAFHDKYKSGELIGRLTTDISEFKHTFKQIITQGLKSITQTLGSTIRLFNISAPLTLTLCATTPILYAVLNFYGAYLRELSKKGRMIDGTASGIASESIANVRTVRAFAAEDRESATYEDMCVNVANSNKYLGYHIGLFQGITNACIGCMVLIVLYFGGTMVIRKEITGGDLMAYMLSTQTTQRSLGSLGVLFGQTIKAMGSAARVFEFIHLQPSIPTRGGIVPDSIEGNIEFRNVNFSYPTRPDHQVLSNFSLTIRKGTMVALCGPSGSGKSTVGSLIERFYETDEGGIYVDGQPIELLDPAWLRQQIGYINQEPTLFATTILENIRYGRPQATKEEVVAAARRANADAFIESFPDEYDTIVGERGVTLSGGQKQRIAIARAILKDPKILILDEATSALAQSEELVQEALDKLMEGRTVIVIAHRLSTIQAADIIIVMGRVAGNIIEQGSHKELLSKKGLYFKLY